MKTIYTVVLVLGLVLLLATESEYAQSNFVGLLLFAGSAYKLGVFNASDAQARGDHAAK